MMNTGIYCIEHKESGKKYVGSASNFASRWRGHRSDLRLGKHHSQYLQRAWNKYGEDAFEFRKLLICSRENLLIYEQLCLDGYGVCNPDKGYNTSSIAGSTLGVRPSEETRAKQSASKLITHRTPEVRAKLRAGSLGKKQSPISLARKAAALRGRTHSLDRVRRASASHLRSGHDKNAPKQIRAFTKEVCLEIQAAYGLGGHTERSLGATYGINPSTVWRILHNKHWAMRLA